MISFIRGSYAGALNRMSDSMRSGTWFRGPTTRGRTQPTRTGEGVTGEEPVTSIRERSTKYLDEICRRYKMYGEFLVNGETGDVWKYND